MRKRKIGYNVYRAPDGCGESFYGFVSSIRDARRIARTRTPIDESMYDTARAAGHCGGMSAPNKDGEDTEPTIWFGLDGWDCAVAVRA